MNSNPSKNIVLSETLIAELDSATAGDIVWVVDDAPPPVASTPPENTAEIKKLSPETFTSVKSNQKFVRIDANRVDNILDLVGELVVIKSQMVQDKAIASLKEQRLTNLLVLLDKTVRELQEHSIALRMTSVRSIFLRLQSAVHDLSERLEKEVNLQIIGEETEIDRGIIELLADPLMHLCRNALDHGIESKKERLAKGKPGQGKVKLEAGRIGQRIYIDISDDGKGIDTNNVLEIARQKGIISLDKTNESYSAKDIFEILFTVGFSTKETSNDISGRGLGLDIVKSNVEQAKGTIEITSNIDLGTCFRIWIPLTTSITDAMLVRVDNEIYALPIEHIRELVEPDPSLISEGSEGHEYINVREKLLPLLKLNKILNIYHNIPIPKNKTPQQKNNAVVIIVEENGTRLAIQVDAVVGKSQVVVKALGPALPSSKGIAGAAVLGDGRIGLIIDIVELISNFKKPASALKSTRQTTI